MNKHYPLSWPQRSAAAAFNRPCRWLPLMFLCLAALGLTHLQAQTVSGVVRDAAGETLIGVNVLIPGTTVGTVTDIDGNYSLDVQGADSLMFRYVGFAERRVAIAGQGTLDVVLTEESQFLNEVVVVGYGVQRRSDVTGAVGSVEAEELTRIATGDVSSSLQGKVAGVQVVPTSGTPGASSVVRIRGIGTFGDARPLYVVDGMLTDDITFLNPNDVERIDVLKDASATAIYGSRGANGVILVTTKRGGDGAREGQENSVIEVDVYRGQQSLIRKLDLANATEFAQLSNQLARNEGRAEPYPNPSMFAEGTDWQDAIFRQALIGSYQLTASGAGARGSYLMSGNYFEQEGIVKGGDFNRGTVRFNADYKLRPRVVVGQNLAFSVRRSTNGPGLLENAYRGYPTLPLLDTVITPAPTPDTMIRFAPTNPVGNVLAQLEYQNSRSQSTRVVGNLYAVYEPIDGLKLRSSLGIDRTDGSSRDFVPEFFVSPLQQNLVNRLSVSNFQDRTWLWENTATYDWSFGASRVSVLGGVTAQESRSEFLAGSVQGLTEETEEFLFLNNGVDSTRTNNGTAGESAILSYLGRVNYAFDDRYLLTVSLRRDGSSRFGRNNRYGYFPSAAAAWRIDQEPFYPTNAIVNRMKARVGFGSVGNDKIGNYPSIPTVNGGLNAVLGTTEALNYGATLTALANPDLRWEQTTSFNAGFELGFFQDKLTAEIDYYNKKSSDILLVVPIPDYIGANPPFVNAATVRNSGIELLLTFRDRVGPVNYHISVNGATVNNEVLGLGQGQEAIESGDVANGRLATRSVVGEPIGSFYGLEVLGVIQNQRELDSLPTRGGQVVGDLLFADTNGDGVITADDRVFLGSPIPDATFGGTIAADFFGFDIAADVYGQIGNEIYNQKRTSRFNTYNFERSYLDAFTEENPSNTEPRVTNGGGNYEVSQRFLESGDFLRLRNLTLGYSLSPKLTDRLRLQRLRVYASATNLAIWDKYSGYTPEVISESPINSGIDRGVYPVPRIITGGLQVSF